MKTWKLFGFTLDFQSYYDGIISAEIHIMGDRCHREGWFGHFIGDLALFGCFNDTSVA